MNAHAFEVLEVQRALDLVSERATSALGRAAIRERRPSTDLAGVAHELARVAEGMVFVEHRPAWGLPTIPDARSALTRLEVDGGVLEAIEVYRLGALLTASRVVAETLSATDRPLPLLESLRLELVADAAIEGDIARTVDDQGDVLDTASKDLGRIRQALRSAHTRIVRALERYVAELPARFVVADGSVSVRDGRYVIPLRREGRGHVGGVVHDESATGATLFVEPPVAVEAMNDLRDLERDERREIQRILRELSGRLRPHHHDLSAALAALVDFDSLLARARAALEWRADPPEVQAAATRRFRLVGARHPLLLARGIEVIPYDLELGEDERTLVVSGPNTGGKSVFLKAVGLIALLTQCGVIPPVRRGTSLPIFADVFADIGDEQSISESLSTFSAHLENLREILTSADAGSLVLIDEMGTGTDPTEGAALARAILEELTGRGALSVVTSHLGALKTLDREGSGIVNASLQFDSERMEPTYRLAKGRPGRSYGLAIARRLGLPADILDRAQSLVDAGSASLEDLLERLEVREREAEQLVALLRRRDAETARIQEAVEARDAELRLREQTAERRAREDARRLLLEARAEVEGAIREVRAVAPDDLDEAARRARRQVEEAARRQVDERPVAEGGESGGSRHSIAAGSRVQIPGGSARGTVLELRDERAVVDVGGIRMEFPTRGLAPVQGGSRSARVEGPVSGRSTRDAPAERGWAGDLPDPASEVDLRGLRVDEVDLSLGRALDGAVLGGLSVVRVIHGKGTGAVRSRVQELLKADPRVRDFRLGVHGEGGAGVTVVSL